eukprot:TRINITY_DN9563_c0_g1_i8.p1 TRINITY_DN9563_c0_g1~~TRINITY_DN9563_c0_g1_i8.p1  ORF type:complete len:446 (-),score=116.84 TRINITY_DN9563_c0_g1_i8:171-1508(-)
MWTPKGEEWAAENAEEPEEEVIRPLGQMPYPTAPWDLPADAKQCDDRSDVWTTTAQIDGVREVLDAHGAATQDRPIPRYQMLIDPNQFVRGDVWVPCEYYVAADGTPTLLGGERAHAQPKLVDAVATPVLAAGLPLLAQLRRPGLLLQERTLQVVVKAQRIIVPAALHDGSDSEYIGLWHVDGQAEHVVAVVLYYYSKDAALKGGAMEFADRSPMHVLDICEAGDEDLPLREATRGSESESVPHCTAPVDEGTLLVFSNYQMVHRVLSMVNESNEREASRDFVALFVIDPLHPVVPARVHLSCEDFLRRALSQRLAETYGHATVDLVLAALGVTHTGDQLRRTRNKLLRAQLQPRGRFGTSSKVYSTGNGCLSMIGWLDTLLDDEDDMDMWEDCEAEQHLKAVRRLNFPPKQLGRGVSEALSITSSQDEEYEQRMRLASCEEADL